MRNLIQIGVVLFFALPLAACGQQDPASSAEPFSADQITEWLHSGNAREVAWAAESALKEKDTSALPDLEFLAEQWVSLPQRNTQALNPAQMQDIEKNLLQIMSSVKIEPKSSLSPETPISISITEDTATMRRPDGSSTGRGKGAITLVSGVQKQVAFTYTDCSYNLPTQEAVPLMSIWTPDSPTLTIPVLVGGGYPRPFGARKRYKSCTLQLVY